MSALSRDDFLARELRIQARMEQGMNEVEAEAAEGAVPGEKLWPEDFGPYGDGKGPDGRQV